MGIIMENIFKNAKPGDMFLRRDGYPAEYLGEFPLGKSSLNCYRFVGTMGECKETYNVFPNGRAHISLLVNLPRDIMCELEEEVDDSISENELNELASKEYNMNYVTCYDWSDDKGVLKELIEAYKKGYREAENKLL